MMAASNDARGRVGILTGAALGLGYAIALDYARAGIRTALIDILPDKLEAVAHECRALGGECVTIVADLSDAGQTQAAVDKAIAAYGTPNVMVHNAAVLKLRPFIETKLADWQREVNIIMQAAFILSQAVWPLMMTAGGGSIVYISSGSALRGFDGEAAYCPGKHGQEGLMKTLAIEGAPHNIAVNTVTPGTPINTPMSESHYTDEQRARWVDPAVISPAFVFLAGIDGSVVTGQRLNAFEIAQNMAANKSPLG
jgi:NAD(P)-dependent dehydrogenase (short-subunit alcohol dehydrogenase family)